MRGALGRGVGRRVRGPEGKNKDKDRISLGASWETGFVQVQVTPVLSRSSGSMSRLT